MGPPNKILLPPSMAEDMAELRRRLDRLERTSQLGIASITDGAGQTRVRMGLFGDGSDYGFEIFNAAGTKVADSAGLIQVMTSGGLVAGTDNNLYATAGASTFVDVTTATSFTLTVTRPVYIDYRVFASGLVTIGPGSAYVHGSIVGFDTSGSIIIATTSISSGFTWYYPASLGRIPAGTYTVKMQVATDAGVTFKLVTFFHQVFLLGG